MKRALLILSLLAAPFSVYGANIMITAPSAMDPVDLPAGSILQTRSALTVPGGAFSTHINDRFASLDFMEKGPAGVRCTLVVSSDALERTIPKYTNFYVTGASIATSGHNSMTVFKVTSKEAPYVREFLCANRSRNVSSIPGEDFIRTVGVYSNSYSPIKSMNFLACLVNPWVEAPAGSSNPPLKCGTDNWGFPSE